tara:strand:+ start:18 stop:374 length:357 start_codon:yes stop_codon:yes gene_type:complete
MFGWIILTSIFSFLSPNDSGRDSPKIIIPMKINRVVSNDLNFNSCDLSKINTKGKENIITVSVVKNSSPKIETLCKIILTLIREWPICAQGKSVMFILEYSEIVHTIEIINILVIFLG